MPSTRPEILAWKHRKAVTAANREKRQLADQLLDDAEGALYEALQDIEEQTGVPLRILTANMKERRSRHAKPLRRVNLANVARSLVAAEAREHSEPFRLADPSSQERTAAKLAELKENVEARVSGETWLNEQRNSKRVALRIDYKQREADTVRTGDSFHEQAAAFSSRTGAHACGFLVRGDIKDTAKPMFYGNELCRRYFVEVLKTDPMAFAQNLEAFCTSGGAQGLAESTSKRMTALKSYIRFTLAERLQLLTNDPGRTMSYKQFSRDIEDRYHITLQGWPLPTLQNPSEVSNIGELDKIRGALDQGTCFFRHMSALEIEQRATVRDQELEAARQKRLVAAQARALSNVAGQKRPLTQTGVEASTMRMDVDHPRKRMKTMGNAAVPMRL